MWIVNGPMAGSSSERVCTSCKEDGISNEGYSYCYNCDSLFCITCDRVHRKFAFDHKVVTGKDIPGPEEKHEFVPCKLHPKETVEQYCKDPELVLCNICKQVKHVGCHSESLSTAFRSTEVSEDLRKIQEQVSALRERTEAIKCNRQLLLERSTKTKQEMKERIDRIRHGMNGVLDRYEEQLTSKHSSMSDDVASSIKRCESLITQFDIHMDSFERAKGKPIQEIVTLAETKNINEEYQMIVQHILDEIATDEIHIIEDKKLPVLIQEITSLGHPEIADSEEVVEIQDEKQNMKRSFLDIRSCSVAQKTDIKLPDDKSVPAISGCCFLPDGTVILCDHLYNKLTMLDKARYIKFTISCSDAPSDVGCIDETSVVVLSRARNSLQFMDIKPGVKLTLKKYSQHSLHGLSVHDKRIFISGHNSKLKTYGVMIFTDTGEENGFIRLVGPGMYGCQYFCFNADGSNIYYIGGSDKSKFVNCLSKGGYGIYSVHSSTLKDPRSIACDANGNLIVCDSGTKCIHLIDSSGIVGKPLLVEKDDFEPKSMCLNASGDTLVVASRKQGSSRVIVYKLDYN